MEAGDIIGTVQETVVVEQKIMVPYGVSGTVIAIESGAFTVDETVCRLRLADGSVRELTLMQKWPVRRGRPYKRKISAGNAADHRAARHRHVLPDR